MASNTNIPQTEVANTFNNWRTYTNLAVDDVNEIARGDFSKPTGNVTIVDGSLTISKGTGTMLTVTANSRISGKLSVHTIESDVDGHVYLNAGDITMGNNDAGTIFKANINTIFNSANVTIGNTAVGAVSGTFNVSSNTLVTAANVTISNATGTFNVGSNTIITASNVTISNADGTLNVASNTTISAQKVSVSNTTSGARFNVSPTSYFFGETVNIANTSGAATFEVTPNTYIYASANVSNNVNVGAVLEVTGNTYLYSNAIVSWNISTGNLEVTQNTSSGNLEVTQNTSTGNLIVSELANIASANITTLSVTSLSVIDPIAAPAESDSDVYRLRVLQTTLGGGSFGINKGGANGNAYLTFVASSNTWQLTANNLVPVTNGYSTILSVANVSDSVTTTSSVNVASLTAVKSAYDQATNAYGQANTATTDAGNAYNQANTATTNAGNAYGQANTATTNAGNAYGAANNIVSGATAITLKGYKDYLVTNTNVNGANTVDMSVSNWYKYTLTASPTITFTNAPPAGTGGTVTIVTIQGSGGGKDITWANTIYWAGGQVPPASNAATGNTDIWTFFTFDGGSTYIGTLAVKDAR